MSLTDKFDRNRKRKPTGKTGTEQVATEGDVENFVRPGFMRNISFVQPDGQMEFYSYADLTNGIYVPEENKLVLTFRNIAAVTLKGRNLDELYEQIQHQMPKKIICVEKRYDVNDNNDIVVHEIFVTQLGI